MQKNIHSLTTLTGSPVRLVTRPVTILSNMASMASTGDQKLSFIIIKNPLEKQKIVLSQIEKSTWKKEGNIISKESSYRSFIHRVTKNFYKRSIVLTTKTVLSILWRWRRRRNIWVLSMEHRTMKLKCKIPILRSTICYFHN